MASFHLVYSYHEEDGSFGGTGGGVTKIKQTEFSTKIKPSTRSFLLAARDCAKSIVRSNVTIISWQKLEEEE